MSLETAYLRAILAMLARQTIPPDDLRKIVAPRGDGAKQIRAYNLCDGKTSQSEISKQTGIDGSNLSKTLARWESAGIVVRGEYPIHVYALTED